MIVNEILNEVRKRFSRAVICKKIGISSSALTKYLQGNPVKNQTTQQAIVRFCEQHKNADFSIKVCTNGKKRKYTGINQ